MRIKILGSGQDGGIPETGCFCEVCNKARKNIAYRRLGPSAALLDEREGFCYLVDASPDFKYQLDMVHKEISKTKRKGMLPLSGILLTHAHLGHCAGLWYLGKESVEEKGLPVFCTPKMKQFLCGNYPFSLLVQRENITVNEVCLGEVFQLDRLKCTPFQVPHRNEVGDTVGYVVESKKKVIYLPDVDRWTARVIEKVRNSDIAFLDGTFYSDKEIPRSREIPHPSIQESINLLECVDSEIYFTHINHANPVNKHGQERGYIERKGFRIAHDGMSLDI